MKVPVFLRALRFDSKTFFVSFLVVLAAQTIDETIGNLADMVKDFTVSFWGVALFIGISIVYALGQHLILGMVKAKNKEKEIRRRHFNTLEKVVTIVQYILVAIMILVVLQIIFGSDYSTLLLRIAIIVSGGLAVYLMGALSYSLLSWFRVNRALIVLLYGSGAAMITISVIAMIVLFLIILQDKPSVVAPHSDVTFPPNSLANSVQNVSGVFSFLLIWGGTILLLHNNIHRIGKVKFWALVSTPLIFFSSFYLSFYQSIAGPVSTGADPIMSIVVPVLVIIFSGIAAATLIGVAFRSVARALSHTPIARDYMMITAYGFILFFTTTLTSIAGTGYPPFGLVNVLLVGPFSFIVLNGLYRSAICVAEDSKLRQSIKTLAKSESKLLDIAATVEIQQDIQKKVMSAIRANAELLEEQSGVESSLTDTEIQEQLEMVTQELKKYRRLNFDRPSE